MTRRAALLGGLGAALAGAGAFFGLRGAGVDVPEGTVRTVERYGDARHQDGEWFVPDAPGRLPTVVLVHGGFWRDGFDRGLEEAVAADLVARGFLVWNIDYRPSSQPWPTTLLDAAAAYDLLATGAYADRVDTDRVAVVGHSAGGHLALWLAGRHRLPEGAPGGSPRGPRPSLAVGQAPVAALEVAAQQGLGGGAVQALLGGEPTEVPDRYAVANPVALLPLDVPSRCLHGEADDIVPLQQSELFVRAAQEAGDDAELVRLPGGHFEHLQPDSPAGLALLAALEQL